MEEHDFKEIIAKAREGKAVLIDVRTEEEYAQGHIPGSINIPIERLPYAEIDDDKTIYVYCLSGMRSERACVWLKNNDYDAIDLGSIVRYDGELEK